MLILTASVCTGWTAKREEAMRAALGVRPKVLLGGCNACSNIRGKKQQHCSNVMPHNDGLISLKLQFFATFTGVIYMGFVISDPGVYLAV